MSNSSSKRKYMHYPTYIENALVTLEFTTMPPKNIQELNKKYHMLALKYHPDKNANHNDIFKDINHSHKIVKEYLFDNDNDTDTDTSSSEGNSSTNYNSIFNMFVQSLISKFAPSSSRNFCSEETVNSIIQTILNKGIHSAVLLFRNMDKQSCLSIYDILSTNQELFSISREILNELHDIVESKLKNDTIINLNPSLSDMLMDKVYILRESDHAYYIPLWHSQLHFKNISVHNDEHNTETKSESIVEPDITTQKDSDTNPDPDPDRCPETTHNEDPSKSPSEKSTSDSELIVLCNPELPPNITIDEHNNIYINDIDIDICELFNNQVIVIYIDDSTKENGFIYELRASDVCLRSDIKQRVRLHGSRGLACINNNEIYNVTKRSNVYAVIKLYIK